MATLINLTPHTLTIINANGDVVSIPSSGNVRVDSTKTTIGNINGFDVFRDELKDVTGLPDPKKDTFFIVSRLVAARLQDRNDILVPGDLIRDNAGNVIGAKGLAVL